MIDSRRLTTRRAPCCGRGSDTSQKPAGGAKTWTAAADLFLYVLYNRTVGHGVLEVTGDDASDASCDAAVAIATAGPVPREWPTSVPETRSGHSGANMQRPAFEAARRY